MKSSASRKNPHSKTLFLALLFLVTALASFALLKFQSSNAQDQTPIVSIPTGTLYEQVKNANISNLPELEPVTISPSTPPASWKELVASEFGFSLYYPPTWSGFPPENIGAGHPTFMGFCPKPLNGSCQDRVPYISLQENSVVTDIQSTLSLEDSREEKIGFRYEKAYSKLDFGAFDGVVIHTRKAGEEVYPFRTIYINIKGKLYLFGFDLENKEYVQVLSTLKEL